MSETSTETSSSLREPRRDDLAPLAARLASSKETERREAVVELAKLGSAAAWSLIVGALADTSPLVADEAELAFRNLTFAPAVPELAGKRGLQSADDLVALRAAGALGSVPTRVDARVFLPALASKDAELRRLALESLERLARANNLALEDAADVGKEVDRLRQKDKDAGVRAAAYLARIWVPVLVTKPVPLTKPVKPRTEEVPEPLAMAEMRVLAREGSLRSIEQAQRGLASESFSMRLESIDALARRPNHTTLGVLTHALEVEPRDRLAWTIVRALRRLSGRDTGRDAAAWIEWHKRLDSGWYPVPDSKDEPVEPTDARAQIFGLPIASDHVAILVDVSSWLAHKDGAGTSLESLVEAEVGKALSAFAKSTFFNLVPFAEAPSPLSKELVAATEDNVRRAKLALAATKPNGKSDLWEALVRASSDRAVDTLIVVTNGTIGAGRHVNLELVSQRFAERNRFQHVLISAVVVGATPETLAAWSALCASTGGRARAYEPVR